MCLSPVTILNPTKYVSIHHKDRFLLQVPCGRCVDCQQQKSSEWLFRTYHEFLQCLQDSRHFVYFDTLTYDEDNLPTLNQVNKYLPCYPCFRQKDIVDFLKRLRVTMQRRYGENSLRYFIASEYGERRNRPHIHVLFFVYCNINPLDFSHLVAKTWKKGLTDGYPWKSPGYVFFHNVIRKTTIGNMLSAAHYVTKYVQKDCKFQEVLDKRILHADEILVNHCHLGSVAHARELEKIRNSVNQFHLQSLHFGESYLSELDLNKVFSDGYFLMPHFKGLKIKIQIPTYYKRKLYYDLIEVNNCKSWCLNDYGKQFKKSHEKDLLERLTSRFDCVKILMNGNFDPAQLADYVLNSRGRYIADGEETTLIERLGDVTHYPYVTRSDKETVGVCISMEYLGNTKQGYIPPLNQIKIKDFIEKYVYLDSQKEELLKSIYDFLRTYNTAKQDAFELKQRLQQIFKQFN